ncbi:hypothetical protein H1R20_g6781, partial [Candolleomyces eurysporus]
MTDIARTFGALMLGGIAAILFCGITQAQVFLYFKLYPKDRVFIKLLVVFIWMLDTLHSAFITTALWDHLISNFGNAQRIDHVPWSLALTIAITAVLTFSVHCFLIYRIYQLSRRNIFIAVPLGMMACARVSFACLTTAKLVQLRSLEVFVSQFTWSFTTGLTISTVLDIFITVLLCYLLRSRQKQYSSMNRVLDALILYTFESGALTMAATLVCLITWLTMPENLIFMGLHFVISKFYANSLLTTLNTRAKLKPGYRSQSSVSAGINQGMPIIFSDHLNVNTRSTPNRKHRFSSAAERLDEDMLKTNVSFGDVVTTGSVVAGVPGAMNMNGSQTGTQLQIKVNQETVHVTDSGMEVMDMAHIRSSDGRNRV